MIKSTKNLKILQLNKIILNKICFKIVKNIKQNHCKNYLLYNAAKQKVSNNFSKIKKMIKKNEEDQRRTKKISNNRFNYHKMNKRKKKEEDQKSLLKTKKWLMKTNKFKKRKKPKKKVKGEEDLHFRKIKMMKRKIRMF